MNEENRERKMDNWIKVVTWSVTELYDFLSWFTGGFDGQLCAMMRLIVCDWITSILGSDQTKMVVKGRNQ